MRATRWSDTEVQQLPKFAAKVTMAELTRKLGRTPGAVTAKAFELYRSNLMHLLASASFSGIRIMRRKLHMASDPRDIAHEVHRLLCSAHPHAGDIDLEKAAELAGSNLRGDDHVQNSVLLAIQKARDAINNGEGAAQGQQLLMDAVRSAEQWIRSASN